MIIGISGKIGSGKDTVGLIIQYLTSPNGFGGIGGKPEFLEHFIKQYEGKTLDCDWEVKKFADKLKDIVCMLIGCTREQLENRDFKEGELGEEWWVYKCRKAPGTNYSLVNYLPKPELDNLYDAELIKMTPRLLLQLLGTDCGRDIIHPQIWVNALMADYISYSARGSSYEFEESKWLVTDTRFPNEAKAISLKKGIVIRVNRGDGNTGTHASETALDDYNDWDYVIDNNGSLLQLAATVERILLKENIL